MPRGESEEPSKALRKLRRREVRYDREQRMLRRISDQYETLEEVFDRRTLMTLYKMLNQGHVDKVHGNVASGKEARIYSGEAPDGRHIAIKIYLTMTSEFKRGRMKYIRGDPRFRSVGRSLRNVTYAWASKEFKNLLRAYEAGVHVPQPIHHDENILVMEFIGRSFFPAPTLRERGRLSPWIYRQVMGQARRLYRKAKLVHADLSEYNVFYLDRRAILFDFAQAVVRDHPSADEFLRRDIVNITRFFERSGLRVWGWEEALEWVRGEAG